MTASFDLVGLGLATIDLVTLTPRLPDPDDVFAVEEIAVQGGGPVATALVAASRLGASTAYLGTIGGGRWGRETAAEFAAYGVDASHARLVDAAAAVDQSLSVILVEASTGRRSILYHRGGLPDLAPDDVPVEVVQNARILHLDGVHLDAALHAARLARSAGVTVSFDGGAGEKWPGIEELLPLVDVLVVAHQFAATYTGESDPAAAGPALLQQYAPREVVITDGERGAWYWDGRQPLHQPAFSVDVVDTTGAGDVFHGAYLFAHLQEWGAERRLAFAAATAALKCRRVGGRAGIPSGDQVEAFLRDQNRFPGN